MKLYLQFGHGMMALSKLLLDKWGGAGLVLSPRDSTIDQMKKVSIEAKKSKSEILFDPQCFFQDTDKERLIQHEYFKMFQDRSIDVFSGGTHTNNFLVKLKELNDAISTDTIIIPGTYSEKITPDWLDQHETIAAEAASVFADKQRLQTIVVSTEVLRSEELIEAIVERSATWEVDGYYVVPEGDSYLSEEPMILANLLLLTSGLKLQKRRVVVGYSSHQHLCLAAANVDQICSGTWLNVRSFSSKKFYEPEDGDIARRGLWYYSPKSLSEYKIPTLDAAKKLGVLNLLQPDPSFDNEYCQPLFAGVAPTTISWGESNAFKHYLVSLNKQVSLCNVDGFDSAVTYQEGLLNDSEVIIKTISKQAISGGDRDFKDCVATARLALNIFSLARKTRLKREWIV